MKTNEADTGRLVLRIVIAGAIGLWAAISLFLPSSTGVLIADAVLIVLSVGYGLGKRRFWIPLLIMTALSAIATGALEAWGVMLVWILLFAGTLYAKPAATA